MPRSIGGESQARILPGQKEVPADLKSLFDLVVFDQVGHQKPHPHIYRLALDHGRS